LPLSKKSRGKANPFPPAKIVLLCLVRIVAPPPTRSEQDTKEKFCFPFRRKNGRAQIKTANKTFLWWGER